MKAVITVRDIVDFPIDKAGDAGHPGHALDVPQRAWRATRRSMTAMRWPPSPRSTERIAAEGAEAHRGRLRGAAACDRCRRGDEARRAVLHDSSSKVRPASPPTSPSTLEHSSAMSRRASGRPTHRRAQLQDRAVHQGYIEPHACVVSVSRTARPRSGLTPGPVHGPRACRAQLLGHGQQRHPRHPVRDRRRLRRQDHIYLEPLALALSRKAGRPVKLVMTRDEVFRASGPTSGSIRRQDRREEGRHDHRRARRPTLSAGRRLSRLADLRRR